MSWLPGLPQTPANGQTLGVRCGRMRRSVECVIKMGVDLKVSSGQRQYGGIPLNWPGAGQGVTTTSRSVRSVFLQLTL